MQRGGFTTPPPKSNAASFEAQAALVEGIEPVPKRVRFRRHVSETAPLRAGRIEVMPPYDLSRDTAAIAAWEEQKAIIAANVKDSGWEPEAPEGRIRVIFVDENNDEWEEEYDTGDLHAMREIGEARGINRPTDRVEPEPEPELLPGLKTQGWSDASDGRIAKPINTTYPSTHPVLARIGLLNDGGCSASLVGRRLVLTAAHCGVDVFGTVPSGSLSYAPRQDGTTKPFGSESNEGAWLPASYIDHNCHLLYTAATRETCGKYDWLLLRLPSTAWNSSSLGWYAMGYWVPGTGWLARNDGYPVCGLSDSPSNCNSNPNRVYGQNVARPVVDHRGTVGGETTIFNTANDISPGHSGSPIWSPTYPDSNGPYVLGHITNQMCGTCNEFGVSEHDRKYPTMARRMTAALAGFITDKRTLYP